MDSAIHKYTVREYAAREQVTPRTVWRWVQKGAVDVQRTPSGRIRIIEPPRASSRVAILNLGTNRDI